MTKKHNKILLEEFQNNMKESGLTQKTIRNHLGNVGLFINDYLFWEEIAPENSDEEIDIFFDDWAIRKNVIFSESSMRQFASSVKKFYKFLYESGWIDKEKHDGIKHTFKDGLPDWLISVRQYEDDLYKDEW